MRNWRRRGRRGQVAAVATILGLLLVVTFIANYLSNTLPNQMAVNDLNHVLQVENQLGRLQAQLEAATENDAIGAQFTQPVTLGGAGQPPFAPADVGSIGPLNTSTGFTVAYLNYSAPTGGIGGAGYAVPASCTPAASTMTCTAAAKVLWNFTGTPVAPGFVLSETAGGTFNINITSSGTSLVPELIAFTMGGSATVHLLILGSNVTATLTVSATSTVAVTMDGSYDTLNLVNSGVGSVFGVLVAGVHDAVDPTPTGAMTLSAAIYGSTDSVGVVGAVGSPSHFGIFFNSYTPAAPQPSCPVQSIASTDTVSGGSAGTGTYLVSYNDSSPVAIPTPPTWWTAVSATPSEICPFFIPVYEAQEQSGFDVHLYNSYIPPGDVAFDEGAIVYAQTGGVPLVVDGPGFGANFTSAGVLVRTTVWFPQFIGALPTDYGIQTTEVAARLVALTALVLTPANNPVPHATATYMLVSVTSSFTSGWVTYYNGTTAFGNHWRCIGSALACYGNYGLNGPVGSAVVWYPTSTGVSKITIAIPVFSVSLV